MAAPSRFEHSALVASQYGTVRGENGNSAAIRPLRHVERVT